MEAPIGGSLRLPLLSALHESAHELGSTGLLHNRGEVLRREEVVDRYRPETDADEPVDLALVSGSDSIAAMNSGGGGS